VQFLLLEKVLFQAGRDCVEVGRLLKEQTVRAWINAPRRMWSGYLGLREFLVRERILSFIFSDTEWGLACNSYHLLDLFAWLTDEKIDEISPVLLDSQLLPSKRSGFTELTGTLIGKFSNGCFFRAERPQS